MQKTYSDKTPKRESGSMYFALARKYLLEILEGFTKGRTFSVKVKNEEGHFSLLRRVSQQLTTITQGINRLKMDPKVNVEVQPTPVIIRETHDAQLASQVQRATTASVEQAGKLRAYLNAVNGQLESLKTAIEKIRLTIPEVQTVRGTVKVSEMPESKVWREISGQLANLELAVSNIKLEVPPQQEIKIPEMPKSFSITEAKQLIKKLDTISEKLDELPRSFPSFEFPQSISVDNFPPVKAPTPVTHMSINSLAGFAKSRAITVSTTPTPLPDEVLAYRRSLVIYNNAASTIYVGGSDVTATNGMPVPATSYSPAFDAGPKMIVYAVTASGTANVRVLELSDENSGR